MFSQKYTKYFVSVSLLVMLVALIMSIAGYGLNMGIDFSGGTLLTYNMNTEFDTGDIEQALRESGIQDMQVSKAEESETLKHIAGIRVKTLETTEAETQLREELETLLLEKYPQMTFMSSDYVGAVTGRDLVSNAIQAILIASLLTLVYIAIRFDFYSGASVVVGLLHDILVMVSLTVILRAFIQINSSYIAAVLTILGYSTNNTIVIFDRIRENRAMSGSAGKSRHEIVTQSVKETLNRTINTTITTLVMIVLLYALGVDAIRQFALPLILGMVACFYSSLFISGHLWAWFMDIGSRRTGGSKKKGGKKKYVPAAPKANKPSKA